MFPKNDSIEQVFWGLINYISGRWYAIGIFSLLFLWAWYLYKEFRWRATQYCGNTPKEIMLLNLQCRRWERYVYQVMVGIGLSVGIAFIMYLIVEMNKDILLVLNQNNTAIHKGINVAYAEAMFFVFLFSIKFRALWDAKGVHNDLVESDL